MVFVPFSISVSHLLVSRIRKAKSQNGRESIRCHKVPALSGTPDFKVITGVFFRHYYVRRFYYDEFKFSTDVF